ncbi:hypothetical protein BH18VER1_BH18VER1_13740 [soil metagenome]
MKTVTVRQFYHNARLVDALPEGKPLMVTSNGKAKFIVTKGAPARMTRKLAEERAVGDVKRKFDGTALLSALRE